MNASPTILLTGKNGQVGWELQRTIAPLGNVIALGRQEMDLADPDSIRRVIREIKPSLIINAAAYTAVDKAEEEPELAMAVNGTAPGVMAEEAKRIGATIVHYSTDYVFDGTKPGAYVETDETNPLSVYGRTKHQGEEAIRESGCKHLIFRTSWVYASRGANFAKTMLRLAKERDELKVVADQIGVPTSAVLIADVTAQVLCQIIEDPTKAKHVGGTYHLTAAGETSWHGYAQFVLTTAIEQGHKLRVMPKKVAPIATSDYLMLAKRPANSLLDTSKLRSTFGLTLPKWESHVARTLNEILSVQEAS